MKDVLGVEKFDQERPGLHSWRKVPNVRFVQSGGCSLPRNPSVLREIPHRLATYFPDDREYPCEREPIPQGGIIFGRYRSTLEIFEDSTIAVCYIKLTIASFLTVLLGIPTGILMITYSRISTTTRFKAWPVITTVGGKGMS